MRCTLRTPSIVVEPLQVGAADVLAQLVEQDVAAVGEGLQARRRQHGEQPTGGQDGDEVAHRRLADVLRRDDDRRAPAAQVAEVVPEPGAQDRVDAGRRLVEEQQLRVVDQRRSQCEAPLHPARALGELLAPVGAQVDEVEQVLEPAAPPAQRHPVDGGDERQVAPHAQRREQHRLLGHVADPRPRRHAEVDRILAEDADRAAARRGQADQLADERGLAAAARADEADDRAPVDGQVDPVEHDLVAERLHQTLGHDDRVGAGW